MDKVKKGAMILGIFTLLIFPSLLMAVDLYGEKDFYHVIKLPLASMLCFTIPLALFCRHIKLYLYLLLPLVLLKPLFITLTFFGLHPGYKLISLVLQTNLREVREVSAPFLPVVLPFAFLYVAIYILMIHRTAPSRIPFKWSMSISVLSLGMLTALVQRERYLYEKGIDIDRRDLVLVRSYPFCLYTGIKKAIDFLEKHNLRQAETFSFNAARAENVTGRQVYLLIIGESSRYDRWQINGYHRATSPRLAEQANLITFSNVVAGAHFTRMAVPQLITRASPDDFDVQFKEKSILCAFKEAGFKTLWLSNQSGDELFGSGSIILHAKTADACIFSPTYSPNFEIETIHDERLLPLLDSVLNADKQDAFIVLHTMGSHWDYRKRYPPKFNVFRPSLSVYRDPRLERRAILNAYDNTIVYTDYLISSIINIVDKAESISAITFISDHGEDLYEVFPSKLNFHFRPSASTLRVPLFIWTSDAYKSRFPEKWNVLNANKDKKVGSDNIFYSLLDIGNVMIDDFNFSKSLASPFFVPSLQKYYDDENRIARLFSQLTPAPSKQTTTGQKKPN